jgi:SAM-dependent methyltransferase
MARTPTPTTSKDQRLRDAVQLAQRGELNLARTAFEAAIAQDRRNLDLVYNLALLEEVAGNTDRAAALYTAVLADKPTHALAARSFARLVTRFQVTDLGRLSLAGIAAALRAEDIAVQPIIDLAANWLAQVPIEFATAIEILRSDAPQTAGHGDWIGDLIPAMQMHDLLLTCLRRGILKHVALERLLTAVREHILCNGTADHFNNRAFSEFALALGVHGHNSDYAWAENAGETAALAALAVDRAALLNGDRDQSHRFMLAAMYRPLDVIVSPPLTVDEVRRLKPRSLRDTVEPVIANRARQHAAAAQIPSLKPLADATSLRVANQYEQAPYPRWHSLQISQPGALKRSLAGFFTPPRLAFMDGTFDVLIAGCGTGQQALQAATAYGPGARLTALDLSRASLGYAADMASRHGIANVTFVHGDILDCGKLNRQFDIIECVGVLHHMADWRAGWRTLLAHLKPAGLMYLGLYSARSRQNLRALRTEPGYPGPGCSVANARAYRRNLALRADTALGGDLKFSRDFYALSAFRDLMLHESEAQVTLSEIAAFLDEECLAFRGFTIDPEITAAFLGHTSSATAPGTLAEWSRFEDSHPRTFDAMYRFWIERKS